MTETQEKKNRRIALATSLGVHGFVLLLLLFMVAWRAPNPPLPEFGIELNFGMDAQGSGDVQPQSPVGMTEAEPEEVEEEPEELPLPEQEEVVEEEVVEEAKPEAAESVQPEVTSQVESPVVVEEKKEEVKPVEKPKEKPAEKVVETKPEKKPETPKAVYTPKTPAKTEGQAAEQPGAPANQGDDVNKPGDKGNPEGALDAKALYGKQGGGGGGVSMTGFGGFGYPEIDTPPLPDESYGVYQFRVKVDEQGYVISVTPLQRGLSFEAERRLKAAIQQLQFVPHGNPKPSEGTITFRVVGK